MNVREILRERRTYIAFGAGILAALALVFFIRFDYYPVAIVNGRAVSAHALRRHYRSASIYYGNLQKTYPLDEATLLTSGELRAAALDQLIENILIHEKAEEETRGELAKLVADKTDEYRNDAGLANVAEALYGIELDEFSRRLLLPQAERDILAGRLFLRGQKLEDWLREARRSAHIVLFLREFRWDGERVIVNK